MAIRNVVVAMPFGKDEKERRKAILSFKRLEYIIGTKCKVIPVGPGATGTRLNYKVDVARTAMDVIPQHALRQIETADILIALLSDRNLNVVYELAYRRARDRTVILLVDSRDNLPIYESSVAYQEWREPIVLSQIDALANAEFPRLPDFTVDIPDGLQDAIDTYDAELVRGLELALQEIENNFVVPPADPVQRLRGVLSEDITRFYPCSIVEVPFSSRGQFADNAVPASVVDFDEAFSELYGYGSRAAALADKPMTLSRLLERIRRFSDQPDWAEFMGEQVRLTETVIRDYGFARASVPLRINGSHTRGEYRSKSFLPCLVAQVIDGDLDGPHRMYLGVVYIEIPPTTRGT